MAELDEMSHDEYVRWGAYYAMKATRKKLAEKMARKGNAIVG